jgi:hypothetical protein
MPMRLLDIFRVWQWRDHRDDAAGWSNLSQVQGWPSISPGQRDPRNQEPHIQSAFDTRSSHVKIFASALAPSVPLPLFCPYKTPLNRGPVREDRRRSCPSIR